MQKHYRFNFRRVCAWLRRGIITPEEAVYLFGRGVRALPVNERRNRQPAGFFDYGPAGSGREE